MCAGEPVSRVLSCERYVKHQPRKGSHSSRPCVAARLKQPTRAVTGRNTPALRLSAGRAAPIRSCSGWGLPCGRRCRFPGALLPHPFTLACVPRSFDLRTIGGLLSVALSLGFGRAALMDGRFLAGRALPAILVSWSPDFPRTGCPDAAARLPGAGAVNSGKRPAGKRNYRVTPRSRSSSSANSMARISPSMMPSTHSGRNRRWNARTAAWPSAMS